MYTIVSNVWPSLIPVTWLQRSRPLRLPGRPGEIPAGDVTPFRWKVPPYICLFLSTSTIHFGERFDMLEWISILLISMSHQWTIMRFLMISCFQGISAAHSVDPSSSSKHPSYLTHLPLVSRIYIVMAFAMILHMNKYVIWTYICHIEFIVDQNGALDL